VPPIAGEPPKPNAPHSRDDLTESDFLQLEGTRAREAIDETLRRLKDDLERAADVRLWTRRYPWAALGAAAVAGFAAATAVVPVRGQSLKEKLTGNGSDPNEQGPQQTEAKQAAVGSGVGVMLLTSLFDLAKIAVAKSVAAAAQPPPAPAPEPDPAGCRDD
jgi:hypothetical protein